MSAEAAPITTPGPVLAADTWPTNGHLIADVHRLGFLRDTDLILDPTYGMGVFWNLWRPDLLIASDLDPEKSPTGTSVDFTRLPWADRLFDAVVFDPPYKLNGTPDPAEHRYGVHIATRWQDRMDLIRQGITECARVTHDRLLVKCQDQVCSGEVRWQTVDFTDHARKEGLRLVERFDLLGGHRPQPKGRRQVHARNRPSTLLIFAR